jgi:hypothetical protein
MGDYKPIEVFNQAVAESAEYEFRKAHPDLSTRAIKRRLRRLGYACL